MSKPIILLLAKSAWIAEVWGSENHHLTGSPNTHLITPWPNPTAGLHTSAPACTISWAALPGAALLRQDLCQSFKGSVLQMPIARKQLFLWGNFLHLKSALFHSPDVMGEVLQWLMLKYSSQQWYHSCEIQPFTLLCRDVSKMLK